MANEEQYVVEKILNRRVRRGVVQFLIKWTGCDETQNTWEPEQNLKCDALVQQFLEEKAAEQSKKRGRGGRTIKSLPPDSGEQGQENIDNEGPAVVNVEKKEEEPRRAPSKQSRNQSRKKGQPEKDNNVNSVVKDEIKEEDLKRDEQLPEPSQKKAVQPTKRGRARKQSLPSDSEQATNSQGPMVKVEKKDDEAQASNEPQKKRGKRSLDTSQGQPDEGSVLVEKVEQKKRQAESKRKLTTQQEATSQEIENGNVGEEESNGFARGYSIENLVGITQEGNKFLFLVKWQGMDEMEMVPSSEVRKYVPEMLIDFYESRIIWKKKDTKG